MDLPIKVRLNYSALSHEFFLLAKSQFFYFYLQNARRQGNHLVVGEKFQLFKDFSEINTTY